MLSIFKKHTTDLVVAEPKANLKGKTVNQVIEEIHETFYTEVDKLLASAKVANSLDTDKQSLIDKCARLKALGFTSTQEVKEAETEIARLEALKRDNEAKITLIEAINYFSFKYPNYKFITEDSVKKICEKYSLVYGAIDKYIGSVPDKNLQHIENFKVLEDDECYVEEKFFRGVFLSDGERSFNKKYKTHAQWTEEQNPTTTKGDYLMRHMMLRMSDPYTRVIDMKCPLEIAAPLKDFDMKNAEVKDFKISKIEIPDPVVLKPVIFNNEKYYLIVTAWGLEAGDELVVNPIHN